MMNRFFTQKHCDRCGGALDSGRTMSRFDTSCICMTCAEKERQLPEYRKAVDAELAAIQRGDRNFPGIGYPKNGGTK